MIPAGLAFSLIVPPPSARAQTPAPSPAPTAASAADLARYDRNHNNRLDPDEAAARDADQRAAAAAVPSTTASSPSSASASSSTSPTGEIVQLSPFEVAAGSDTGYYASNTLSGTRIDSKIEDLGASITVVTKQQLLDTAALDLNDIFLYEANTEGTGTFTAFTVGRNGDVNDSVQSSPETANRIRGIGSANIARDNFASDSRIPIDTFNVDSVEISRGPNSNIFGLGNSSGTVNVTKSQANVQRDRSEVVLRGDSFDGYRGSFDLNRVLKQDRLAFRLLGLYDSVGYVRKPSQDITHRLDATLTFKPFPKTTFYADYQSYHNYNRRPNSITPRDTVSYWRASGSPTWDPVTATAYVNDQPVGTFPQSQDANLPAGLYAQGTGFYNRPGMFIEGDKVAYWSVNRTTNTNNANSPNTNVRFLETGTDIMRRRGSTLPLFVTPGVTDKSLYDWTSDNFVAPNYGHKKADIYSAQLEQIIVDKPMHLLAAQLGFYREDVDEYSRNFIGGNSAVLYVDPNRTLLDGTPNPFYLRPYIGASEPTTFSRPSINDNGRLQVAYQLNFEQAQTPWMHWLGRHRALGYLEGRRITTGLYRFRELVLDNHTWVNPANRANGNAANRAYFKYYLGDNQAQNIDYPPPALYGVSGTYNFHWLDGTTGQWNTEPATIGQAAYISNRTQQEIRSRGGVLQSFFLDERVVTTVGTRRDKNRSRDSNGAVIDPATGFYSYAPLNVWQNWEEQQGTTSTRGIVVKPFRGWRPLDRRADNGSFLADVVRSTSFFYNKATTFQPAAAAYTLFGEVLPNPTGEGRDYGFNITLGRKFSLRVDRYETDQHNARGGDAGIVATRANRLDFGNDGFNLEDQATTWVAQLHPELNAEQQRAEVYRIMQLPGGFIENLSGKDIAETQDVTSRGWEFEINYNPTPHWTVKLAGAEQKTIDSNLSPNIQRYLDERLPVWQSVINPIDNTPWWTTSTSSAGTPQAFYLSAVLAPYKLATANQGRPRSQVREWSWNLTTSYNLSGLSDNHWLRDTNVGGAVRWQDRGSIGFLGAAPDADGVIRSYDPNRPVYDPSHTYVDLLLSHRFRFNKVSMNVQLNVRNVFEDGRLQTIGINPDGSGYNFRIIDPRQFILTTTFEF
jgi:outer membrane receptor for ferric coprogen and ferric-rhodotorulic acid